MPEKKTLGLIGLGAFGRLMVEQLHAYFDVLACDPSAAAQAFAQARGMTLVPIEQAAAAPYVVLAVPVPCMEEVLREIKPHIRAGALVMDVGSVKMKPAALMDSLLPEGIDLLCTHPLFGPQGAKNGTQGLKMVLCPLRGPSVQARLERLSAFLQDKLGIEPIVATPDEHDREMAYVQGLPHMIARVLMSMEPLPRRMVTPNYNLFLQSVDIVRQDTEELFKAILKDNPYSQEIRDLFFEKAEALRRRL